MSAGQKLPGTPDPMHFWNGEGGVTTAGGCWGDTNGPLVLLQHGGGQTRHAWKGAGEQLGAAGYYAVAFDARGHGDSAWAPDGDYGQDVMVRDLAQVVAELVLVDTAPRVGPEGIGKIQAFMHQRPEGFNSLDEMVAGDRNDIFGNAVIEFLLRVVSPTFAPRQPPQALQPHRERLAGDIKDIP